MKPHISAALLTMMLWAFWLVPLKGKTLAPDFLGTSEVQWFCAAVVAICIPIAVLMALKLIAGRGRRRVGLAILGVASLPLLYNLVFYGVVVTMSARTNLSVQRLHARDAEVIADLTDRAIEESSAAEREKAAGGLFEFSGVRPVWNNERSQLERYHPSAEQEEVRARRVDTAQAYAQTTDMLDWQLQQVPWLFGLNLGAFCVIVFAGLASQAFKPNSEQAGSDQPATGTASKPRGQ
jgi:hypothetical protein